MSELNLKDNKTISLFGFKVWCDTCNRMKCKTRNKYIPLWEEIGVF